MGQLCYSIRSINLKCVRDWFIKLFGFGKCGIRLASLFEFGAISVEPQPDWWNANSAEFDDASLSHGFKSDERLFDSKCVHVGSESWS
jgi:hypothetical protein